jgi:ABC-type protease/lipase transport system fused ATPase/permease subunit
MPDHLNSNHAGFVGNVHVRNVSLTYPGAELKALNQVSFEVLPNSSIAIVGPSGSGKSSLARALVGVWPPLVGHVRLDGADIYQWNKDELGKYIGYLPQDIDDGELQIESKCFSIFSITSSSSSGCLLNSRSIMLKLV